MKRLLFPLFLLITVAAHTQLLSWTPAFIQENSTPVTITMDANFGNRALLNYATTSDVYVHIGAITNLSSSAADWKYVKFTWGTTNASAHCTYLGNNKWQYTITGGLRNFFGISNGSETIREIAILFRNGTGSIVQRNANGADMYVPVYDNGVHARIDVPYQQPLYDPVPEPIVKNFGDPLSITAKSSVANTLKIFFNGNLLTTSSTTTATANTMITTYGNQRIIAEATDGITTSRDTVDFFVSYTLSGLHDGINYEPGDTSVTLVLYAPHKKKVVVVGDFNNWTQSDSYKMNVTPDSARYTLRITHLTKGTEYAYQYVIDDTLKVADYNTEKILDPVFDPAIPSTTYPNLKPYPTGKTTGIVSILQTAKPQYAWQVTNFLRPDKRNLIIYELLVRDFIAAQNWQTLKDTLTYLKRLGVNAIEVMPFNEFEGNNSWGYNPDFYFAPDKFYGTEMALKQFIDECHKQGFAVIMDMVLNHSFGQSPMVQMYWDKAKNVPAANSPWFNQYPTHAFNVGYQFNHEAPATKDFTYRVINFWLTNYHLDGYRYDLAKGFTQRRTCDAFGNNCDVNAWGQYDDGRVAIWDSIYDQQQRISPNSYCILEMFADNSEETVESDRGMMLWGNMNYNYNQATMGYITGSDLSWGIYKARGWSQPHLITYQESHDEERLMYRNEQFGNFNGSYNVKDTATGLSRNGMAAAFWAMQPGPKMMWEFGELGYDLSINRCTNGTVDNNCRLDPKPPRWDYYNKPNRKALFDIYSNLIHLRTYPDFPGTFTTGATSYSLVGALKWESISGANLQVMVFGNFDVVQQNATITFPSSGKWYNYLTTGTLNLASTSYNVTL
ncbi:MAG TPA: alpha-amylase family glycosyl hydrolase, partial [Parafilimonas sp.]|nr:alpha-amylase family glycosyl hydrolase [Parafilimonas sp.]